MSVTGESTDNPATVTQDSEDENEENIEFAEGNNDLNEKLEVESTEENSFDREGEIYDSNFHK